MKIAKIEQFFPRAADAAGQDHHRQRAGRLGRDRRSKASRKSTLAAVEELADYLIGKDPLRIEHHWQHIYRSAFFRGGAIVLMSALSGIDQALWDIAGKHYGVPVYQLLGGADARPGARVRPLGHPTTADEAALDAARERLD